MYRILKTTPSGAEEVWRTRRSDAHYSAWMRLHDVLKANALLDTRCGRDAYEKLEAWKASGEDSYAFDYLDGAYSVQISYDSPQPA